MKVLFVWLNNGSPVGFSHGLAVLSGELKEAGHVVELLHVNEQLGAPFDEARLRSSLRQHAADVVGLSFGSNHAPVAAKVARWARDELPDCWVVAGGVHSTLHPEEVLAWPGVDLVARGEMDGRRFVAVVADLERGRLPQGRPGIWYRRDGHEGRTPMGPPVDVSGTQQPMDLSLFDHRRILQLKRGWADVLSGRGCPHSCNYCFNEPLRRCYLDDTGLGRSALRYVRKRPIDAVLAELDAFQRHHGDAIRVFSFVDDVFPVRRSWLTAFLEAYRSRFDVPLVFLATAAHIDEELARRCADAGVYMVRIGVESGSARIREQVLNRQYSNATIKRAVTRLQAAHVKAFAFLMLGLPGETMRDLWATFRLTAKVRFDAARFSMFWPYPGTALFDHCRDNDLLRGRDGFTGNYLSSSPLRWPAPRRRLLERITSFYDVALNRYLDDRRDKLYAELLAELRRMSDDAWRDGGANRLRQQADALTADVLAVGGEAYTTPFADRRDIVMLAGTSSSVVG